MRKRRIIQVVCTRFDPSADAAPYEQTYQVPLVEGMSVQNILTFIYENLDPSLGFYSCCDRGVCGRCTMMINGKPALSCTTLVQGDLHLDPLRGRMLIRDLVVKI